MRQVVRRTAAEVEEVQSWTREEARRLIAIAREHEPRIAPLVVFLFATGARRGEALGLRWEDVDFDSGVIRIRRAITRGEITTPKNGRGRKVGMSPGLASELFDLFALRRRECLERGWSEVPAPVFCSEAGTPLDNLRRVWERLRRRAQAQGIRPLPLHSARHTWATHALDSGKSIRWVADQLGHADPALTLRVYTHVLRDDEEDLSFSDFGATNTGSKRLYPAPGLDDDASESRNYPKVLAPPGGLASSLRLRWLASEAGRNLRRTV